MRISDWSSDVCSSDLKEAGCREPFRLAALAEDRSGRSCLWWRIDPRWGRKWNRRTLVRTVIGGTAANPSGRIADLRRSRRSASDSLRQYRADRSEEHTSELQSLMRHSYAVFCLNKTKISK